MDQFGKSTFERSLEALRDRVVQCRRCPRLVAFREAVPILKLAPQEKAWRRPVPGFGDPNAWLFILGLAPSIVGGNRTGRLFTGDESGKFLFKCLYQAGFASQPDPFSASFQLSQCYLTASVKCVPPSHKPLREEFVNCCSYFENEFWLLKSARAVLALGKNAFDVYRHFVKREGGEVAGESFAHGKVIHFSGWPPLIGSYHPSPQNTNTGKLTETMFLSLLENLKKDYADKSRS